MPTAPTPIIISTTVVPAGGPDNNVFPYVTVHGYMPCECGATRIVVKMDDSYYDDCTCNGELDDEEDDRAFEEWLRRRQQRQS